MENVNYLRQNPTKSNNYFPPFITNANFVSTALVYAQKSTSKDTY